MQLGRHDSGRRLDAMNAVAFDLSEVLESGDEADDAVTAHLEISGVVEKDRGCGAGRIGRRAEDCADERVRAARFADDCGAEAIKIFLQSLALLLQRAAAKVRATFDNNTCRLARGVRVDDAYHSQGGAHEAGF